MSPNKRSIFTNTSNYSWLFQCIPCLLYTSRRISNGPIEGKNYYIKKILYNGNGMKNFERTRNRILYSQNKYKSYDLDIEYTGSIKIEKSDLLSDDDDTDEFEE